MCEYVRWMLRQQMPFSWVFEEMRWTCCGWCFLAAWMVDFNEVSGWMVLCLSLLNIALNIQKCPISWNFSPWKISLITQNMRCSHSTTKDSQTIHHSYYYFEDWMSENISNQADTQLFSIIRNQLTSISLSMLCIRYKIYTYCTSKHLQQIAYTTLWLNNCIIYLSIWDVHIVHLILLNEISFFCVFFSFDSSTL